MCKNTVGPGGPQITIWRLRIACWIPKATNTHSEYVILIAFQLQQWLHNRASMLRYTYIDYLVLFYLVFHFCIFVLYLCFCTGFVKGTVLLS
jgi:hypothetical protein